MLDLRKQFSIVSVDEMYAADAATIESGVSGLSLMENAGGAVTTELLKTLGSTDRVLVICGCGNNGGDGFVIAQRLYEAEIDIDVMLLGDPAALSGDAALARDKLKLVFIDEYSVNFSQYTTIVDALFGAGLNRPIIGTIAALIDNLNRAASANSLWVISVDLPSGINGNTGEVCGTAVMADQTVTFFRQKPGHLLYPGKAHCGNTIIKQIGISDSVLADLQPSLFENDPTWWQALCPQPDVSTHKYLRGHAVVVSGGPTTTGAARMTANAALRTGAGLVTMCCRQDALVINATHLTAIMLKQTETPEQLRRFLEDTRITVVALGPGLGTGEFTRQCVKTALSGTQAVVLDADALTSFEKQPTVLFEMIKRAQSPVVLTPHTGEFNRLFGQLVDDSITSKVMQARDAARQSGAIIVYKGADTVIADPDGTAAINTNAPSWLATAGSGDVLAGTIAGWLAQGMEPFEGTCAACWMHGESAKEFGPGLIATDLPEGYPAVLKKLLAGKS